MKEPMTLKQLQDKLQSLYDIGATGDELVFLEASVITGVEGLNITTNAKARHAVLCNPVTMGIGRIVKIWAA